MTVCSAHLRLSRCPLARYTPRANLHVIYVCMRALRAIQIHWRSRCGRRQTFVLPMFFVDSCVDRTARNPDTYCVFEASDYYIPL